MKRRIFVVILVALAAFPTLVAQASQGTRDEAIALVSRSRSA
jgi:hypothetical protein